MKRVYKKRLVYALVIAFSILLQGCSKQKMQEPDGMETSGDVTYEGEDIIIQGLEGDVAQCSVKDGFLYILTWQDGESHLYKAAADGSDTVEISAEFSENEKDSRDRQGLLVKPVGILKSLKIQGFNL